MAEKKYFICNAILCEKRRLWRVCTFAQAYLSLRHINRISCAASNGDMSRAITPAAETGESAHLRRVA